MNKKSDLICVSTISTKLQTENSNLKNNKMEKSLDDKTETLNEHCVNNNDDDDDADDNDCDTDIISDYIGHYGVWQFFWTFLLCLFQLPCTFHIFSLVFQAANRDFWCARPTHLRTIDIDVWRNLTQPNGACSIYNLNYWGMSDKNFTASDFVIPINTQTIECKSFEFDDSLIGDTIISEWNLVCDEAKFVSVVEMCFLAGAAIGSICSGWISDRFGRRHTLMIFAVIQTVVGTILTFSKSLPIYMTLRFIIGFASMSVVVVSFVLVVELVSGKYRLIIGILNILPVAMAYIITAGISYLTYEWRVMQLFISVPCFSLLLIWYYLPESPRWLLAKGRIDELVIIIDKAAKVNRIILPPNYAKTLIPPPANSSNTSILELFSKKYCRTTILMIVVWFSLILLYFGLTLHLSNLGGNIYTNTIIAGSVEAISILLSIFVVLKLGLRINLFVYMLIAGVACLLINFVPDGNLWLIITLAMIGKCTIGANNALIPIFTAGQYKCVMRNIGIGIGNFSAGFALIIVPYLWLLEHVQVFLPMTIMGIFGIIGAFALFLMKDKTDAKSLPKPILRVAESRNSGIVQNDNNC